MPIVKISRGEAHVKDIYPRKTRREANMLLYDEIGLKPSLEKKGGEMDGVIKVNKFTDVQSFLMTQLVDKIIIDGVSHSVSQAIFDNDELMTDDDYNLIVMAIDKITKKELPNEQKALSQN